MAAARWLLLGGVALGGCATKGDLRRVEDQLVISRGEAFRADSARAAQLNQIIALHRRIIDSLGASQRALQAAFAGSIQSLKGDLAGDLYSIQQQLVQVQALTGQSQQRLTELRTQLEARSEQLNIAPAQPADSTRPATPANAPSADQVYEASLQQLRRGSPGTARLGFRELLRLYPSDPRVPDAIYFIGESFAAETPDSAAPYYAQVEQIYPSSSRTASALYKLGLIAERKKDVETARSYYQRVIREHPRSDEAALARDRLKTLGR